MTRRMTAEQLEALRREVCDRAVVAATRLTREEWEHGEAWYARAHSYAVDLAMTHKLSLDVASAVIAVLSPRMTWKQNKVDAAAVCRGDTEHLYTAFSNNVAKAFRIVDTGDPDAVLSGRKVRAFWQNIKRPTLSDDGTLDYIMLVVLVPERYLHGYVQPYGFLARHGVYDAVCDGLREAARVLCVLPLVLQAALWIGERGDHE